MGDEGRAGVTQGVRGVEGVAGTTSAYSKVYAGKAVHSSEQGLLIQQEGKAVHQESFQQLGLSQDLLNQ